MSIETDQGNKYVQADIIALIPTGLKCVQLSVSMFYRPAFCQWDSGLPM